MTAPTWPGDSPGDLPAGQRPAGEDRERRDAVAGRGRAAGRPTRARSRQEARRARLVTALGKATTPALRVSAAADYVRASLGDLPPARAQQVGAEAVEVLIGMVDQAVKEEGKR
jgi:hypothetical protein